jgi:hypothetical protein
MSKHPVDNKETAEWLAGAFGEVDWPIPVSNDGLSQSAWQTRIGCSAGLKLEVMHAALAAAYTSDYLARMFVDRYCTIQHCTIQHVRDSPAVDIKMGLISRKAISSTNRHASPG